MKKERFLYIQLAIQDGNREHIHRVLHSTYANNLWFAAMRYTSTFWGEGKHNGEVWEFDDGELSIKLENYKELTEKEHEYLHDLMYS